MIPDLKTAYQVGRGMMRHVMALAEAEAGGGKSAQRTRPPPRRSTQPRQWKRLWAEAEPPGALAPEAPEPPRRHMRFSFAEDEHPEVHS